VRAHTARNSGWIIAILVAITLVGTAGAQSTGGPGTAGVRPSASMAMSDGTLQLSPAPGWELNPRLAKDNGVPGFLHPSGMQQDQTLPAWMLVDRRPRNSKLTFEQTVQACLTEGKVFAYFPADSAVVTSADGRTLATYRFNLGADGSERGLAFLDAPDGIILFRYETVSSDVWKAQQPAFDAMLRSVRFLPKAK
jgi:hypothetical protein